MEEQALIVAPQAEEHGITPAQARIESVAKLLDGAYAKASTLELSPDEIKALQADFPDDAFKKGAAGKENLIYIEHAFLRDRLNQVIGVGKWALITRNRWQENYTTVNGKEGVRIYVEAVLMVRGCFAGEAVGDMSYYPNNDSQNYGDAVEGARTAALRRCCKEFGIGLQAWKKDWCEGWWRRNPSGRPQNAPEAPKATQTPSKQENAPKGHVEPQSVAIKHATETTRAWFISEFLNAKPNTNERLVCEAYFRALKWLGDEQPIDLLPLCYVPTSIGQARTILPYLGTFQQEGRAAEPWPAVNAPEPQKTGWRAHKVVWTKGKFANLPLGELPKDFLFQMWRTYEVKDTWEDKAGVHKKSEASMEKDKAFRLALDEAGKELNFREEPA